MAQDSNFVTLAMLLEEQGESEEDDKILAQESLPDDWTEWQAIRISKEELFGDKVEPHVMNKLMFALPTVGLARAFDPTADHLSEKGYRDIRLKLLDWAFARAQGPDSALLTKNGGIGTLVGTGTNLAFKGLFAKAYPDAPELLSFPKFSAFGVPLMIVLEIFVYFCMVTLYFGFLRPNSELAKKAILNDKAIAAAKAKVDSDWKKLGTITWWEIECVLLFSFGIALFFFRSPKIIVGWGDAIENYFSITKATFVKDSAAAFVVGFLMMVTPYTCEFFKNFTAEYKKDLPNKRIRAVLSWEIMNVITPYSFMFLLGGGFCLSAASTFEFTDLNGRIGGVLKSFSSFPNILIILLLIIFTVFVTNFASNVAVCNVVVPIAMTMAKEVGYNPLWYAIACGFGASFCFCLPVGTPANLVAQSAAKIPTGKMIKAGVGPTCTTIILTWLFVYFYAPIIWPEVKSLPSWTIVTTTLKPVTSAVEGVEPTPEVVAEE